LALFYECSFKNIFNFVFEKIKQYLMNAPKIVAVLATSLLLMASCKQETASAPGSETAQNEKAPAVKPETASMHIEGMTCAIGCAKTIEEKLAETPGVQEAKVDFDKKEATVHFDADKLSEKDLTKLVESCADGKTYKVSNVKVEKKA
jgi:Cu+-exporting ATPase